MNLFSEIEGFLELAMHEDAWEAIEDLPAETRSHPEALRLRLLCCTGLKRWQIGEDLARILGESTNPLRFREVAGRFHLAHAIELLGQGNIPAAKEQTRKLSERWPEGRIHVCDDPAFDGVFGVED